MDSQIIKGSKGKRLIVSGKSIKYSLGMQASYSLHKTSRKNFKRNITVVRGLDPQWQADLADIQAVYWRNKGTRYIVTVIDVFSKYS